MKVHRFIFTIFFTLSLAFTIVRANVFQDLVVGRNLRRILHQPLYPEASTPPPSPPSPVVPELPNDQPFFPEVPTGPTPDQAQQSPPIAHGTAVPTPVTTPAANNQTKPVKKFAIAISVGIVTLGMLSALAFYLYKHRGKNPDESQKLVPAINSETRIDQSSIPSASTFLYIGTVEPSAQATASSATEANVANASPYRKLASIKRSEQRYRPSPDLQPLPPLTKPPPPPAINSPPPMSSSDEESHDTTGFYTPQGSSVVSNDDGSSSRSIHPHSKRTSPKSRLYSSSSPEIRHAIIPSIKQAPPPPPPPQPTNPTRKPAVPYAPKRAKYSAPPPPPDMARLQLISDPAPPLPPRPPPPPPPPPRKAAEAEMALPPPPPRKPILPIIPKTAAIQKPAPEEELNGEDVEGTKPRLKPLHWDKVRATSDRATVWDQLKSSSFQLNEDMMESLFGFNTANSAVKEATGRKPVLPPVEQENRVLDPKKSQNIAILLRALNVTRDEVSEALLDGNPEGLGPELLETLVKMAPTKEEEIKLRNYNGDISKLGSAERFLKAILDVPFAFKRVEAMLYRANFESEVNYLRKSFQTLEVASQELKESRLFLKLLDAVLRTGNRMNVGTNRGDARAFKLDTLLKLVDIKGTDGKTTLLHFVVQEIIRSEGSSNSEPKNDTNVKPKEDDFKNQGLQVVAGLSKELGNVRKAAAMDSDVLSGYVSKLEGGLQKVRQVLQLEKQGMQGQFFSAMKSFLKEAGDDIVRIKDEEKKALSSVKEVTEYFHGNAAKEEAHPLRVFMIVRDFLSILDNVCKEVSKLQDRSMVTGTGRSFRMPATASLPVLSRYNGRYDRSSDEDSSSSSLDNSK